MAHQYIFVMKDLKKIVPPKREILKGIWLSFYPGAKIAISRRSLNSTPRRMCAVTSRTGWGRSARC